MQSALLQPLLVEFIGPNIQSADWQETVSNSCLFFLRTAYGTSCKLPTDPSANISIIEKTNAAALKAFAGLIAFTLWLPFTIVGIILWHCSQSHNIACIFAQKCIKEPTQSTKHPKDLMEESLYAYTASERKHLDTMTKLFFASSIQELENFLTDLNNDLSKFPAKTQEVLLAACLAKVAEHPIIANAPTEKLEQQLVQRFSKMSNEEYACFLPLLEKHTFSRFAFLFSTLESSNAFRFRVIGEMIMRKIKRGSHDCWVTWNALWEACKKAEGGDLKAQPMLQDALNIIGDHQDRLVRLYELAFGKQLIQLLTNQQLASLTRGLLKKYEAEGKTSREIDDLFLKLTTSIVETTPSGTVLEKIERIVIVPITLGKHPLTWGSKIIQHNADVPTLEYFVLHEVQKVLINAAQLDRMQQIHAISQAFKIWEENKGMGHDSEFSPNFPQAIAEVAISGEQSYFSLIFEGLDLAYLELRKSLKSFLVSTKVLKFLCALTTGRRSTLGDRKSLPHTPQIENKISKVEGYKDRLQKKLSQYNAASTRSFGIDRLHVMPHHVLGEITKLPVNAQQLESAFRSFLDHTQTCFNSGFHEIKTESCFISAVWHIKTIEVLDAAINAIITANFPALRIAKTLARSATNTPNEFGHLGLNANASQVARRISDRIYRTEMLVRANLDLTDLKTFDGLQAIILEYLLSVRLISPKKKVK